LATAKEPLMVVGECASVKCSPSVSSAFQPRVIMAALLSGRFCLLARAGHVKATPFVRPLWPANVHRPALYLALPKGKSTSGKRAFHGHMHDVAGGAGEQSLSKRGAAFAGAKEMRAKQLVSVMVEYVWPKDNPKVRRTVVTALGLLVGAKLLNISVPFFFKHAVDGLNVASGGHLNMDSPETAAATAVFALLFGYGVARAGSAACNELRNAVFAKVAQHSIRKIAQNVFKHLHNLDLVRLCHNEPH